MDKLEYLKEINQLNDQGFASNQIYDMETNLDEMIVEFTRLKFMKYQHEQDQLCAKLKMSGHAIIDSIFKEHIAKFYHDMLDRQIKNIYMYTNSPEQPMNDTDKTECMILGMALITNIMATYTHKYA